MKDDSYLIHSIIDDVPVCQEKNDKNFFKITKKFRE